MNLITRRDQALVIAIFLLLSVGALGSWLWTDAVLLTTVAMALLAILGLQVGAYRSLQAQIATSSRKQVLEIRNTYQQIESLFFLYSSLAIKRPLPPMGRNWAIAPDFAAVLVSSIFERKPRLILEAGSGVSTLISAYALKEIGAGRLVSLEHDDRFSRISSENVKKHRLDDVAKVIHAPLREAGIQERTWLWYDLTALREVKQPIDMLIVDGPPRAIGSLARYPALPILIDLLADDVLIFLDDGNKKEVQELVELWLKEFDGFECESMPTVKGTLVLRRKRLIRAASRTESLVPHVV